MEGGGLCMMSLSVWLPGPIFRSGGLSLWSGPMFLPDGSLSIGGLCLWGLCPLGVSVEEGISVQGGLCAGGLCPGGNLCPGGGSPDFAAWFFSFIRTYSIARVVMEAEWWTSVHCVAMTLRRVQRCARIMSLTRIHKGRSSCAHSAAKGWFLLYFTICNTTAGDAYCQRALINMHEAHKEHATRWSSGAAALKWQCFLSVSNSTCAEAEWTPTKITYTTLREELNKGSHASSEYTPSIRLVFIVWHIWFFKKNSF